MKFDRDHNYIIPHKPIENGKYINQNDLWAVILKIRKILDGDHMLHLGNLSDRAKRSLFSIPVGLLTTKLRLLKNIDLGSHDLRNVNLPLPRKPYKR